MDVPSTANRLPRTSRSIDTAGQKSMCAGGCPHHRPPHRVKWLTTLIEPVCSEAAHRCCNTVLIHSLADIVVWTSAMLNLRPGSRRKRSHLRSSCLSLALGLLLKAREINSDFRPDTGSRRSLRNCLSSTTVNLFITSSWRFSSYLALKVDMRESAELAASTSLTDECIAELAA